MGLRVASLWFAAGLAFLAGCANPPGGTGRGWQLVWVDEFEGQQLDLTKWEFEVNAWGGGNAELQYYVTNNVRVAGGKLYIEARNLSYSGPEGTRQFTSSRIRTKGKGDWRYGRFEFRAQLPAGRGLWPAIWMLPTDNVYGGWPHSGEIDIVELLGHEPQRVHGTLHYSDAEKRHAFRGTNQLCATRSFAEDFHVFRLDWLPGEFRWYVDGRLYQTQTAWPTAGKTFPAPFDQRFHLILNVAVGGRWPGNPDGTTIFPQAMVVDYVRVFQPVEQRTEARSR